MWIRKDIVDTRKGHKKTAYRKKTRELLMRLIFQMTATEDFSEAAKAEFLSDTSLYIGDVSDDTPLGCLFDEAAGEAPDLPYLEWAILCVREQLAEIDRVITEASKKWSVGRMSTVDLAILRLAVAEIKYMDGIDDSVSVNEAVLMAHKYGTEKSAAFINGILGAIIRAENQVNG